MNVGYLLPIEIIIEDVARILPRVQKRVFCDLTYYLQFQGHAKADC